MQNLFYRLIRQFFVVIGLIPKRWTLHLANALGTIWFYWDKRHRKVALRNLTYAFGNEKNASEIERIACIVFRNIARIPFEIGWSLRLNQRDFMCHCQMTGLSNLQSAYAKGKGILILTVHLGNWELLPIIVTFQGIPVSFIYRPLDFKPADRFLYEYRCRFGGVPLPKKKSMRKVLRPLQRQECVGILLDQDSGRTAGVFADFFGRPACTNKGLALLALKTEAPVIPAFLVRCGMSFKAIFGQEIPLIKTGQKEKDIQRNTLQYNQVIEDFIRRYPEQWLWVHNRWKTPFK